MNVKLVAVTKPVIEGLVTAEDLIVYTARVSNPSNQMNTDTGAKLIKYCIKNKHWSIFDQAEMTVEIKTSRAIAAQILRHWSFDFQEFCMAGDQEVYFDRNSLEKKRLNKLTLETLWNKWNKDKESVRKLLIRSYDVESKTFIHSNIKEVFKTGIKPIYELTLFNGKKIRCTKEHKVLFKDGFKSLEEGLGLGHTKSKAFIKINAEIGCNGIPHYQTYEWLKEAKERSIISKQGLKGIADEAEVSTHTIRKWLKINKLCFSKREVASLAYSKENIQVLCHSCHIQKHHLENDYVSYRELSKGNSLTINWSKVKSVEFLGEQMTYDLEINSIDHNYIAGGVVVHNSQRYAEVVSDFEPIELRLQGKTNRQVGDEVLDDPALDKEIQIVLERTKLLYDKLIEKGVAKECARFVLPLSTQTTLYMKGSCRNWIHYLELRCSEHTQKEHRLLAQEIKKIFMEQFPIVSEALEY